MGKKQLNNISEEIKQLEDWGGGGRNHGQNPGKRVLLLNVFCRATEQLSTL